MKNDLPFVFQVDITPLSGGKVAPSNVVGMPVTSLGKVEFAEIVLQRTEFSPGDAIISETVEIEMSKFCPTCFVSTSMFVGVTMEDHLSKSPLCRMENLHDE